MPKISVLLATYNNAPYLREAVDSILKQTFDDFELIIINDASTDETRTILESYTDPRIRLIHNKQNLKLPASLNRGLEIAQTDYIARMDGDDICLPNRFACQMAYFAEHPEVDVLGTQMTEIDPQGNIIRKHHRFPLIHSLIVWYTLFAYSMGHASVIMKRHVLDEIGGYDTAYPSTEDRELWTRLIYVARFANLPDDFYFYRQHDLSTCAINQFEKHPQVRGICAQATEKLINRAVSAEYIRHIHEGFSPYKRLSNEQAEEAISIAFDTYQALLKHGLLLPDELDEVRADMIQRMMTISRRSPLNSRYVRLTSKGILQLITPKVIRKLAPDFIR